MTLGEIIKQYRVEHNMSMDSFAMRSGLSKGYISMLERNTNPSNGQPLTPSIDTYKNCAKAMGITINELFDLTDDDVDISNCKKTVISRDDGLSADEIEILNIYRMLPPEYQEISQIQLKALLDKKRK